jgi:hypothetical protein
MSPAQFAVLVLTGRIWHDRHYLASASSTPPTLGFGLTGRDARASEWSGESYREKLPSVNQESSSLLKLAMTLPSPVVPL